MSRFPPFFVIPAKAGIQTDSVQVADSIWTPAFAGMTKER
jgi:hypothetical protein